MLTTVLIKPMKDVVAILRNPSPRALVMLSKLLDESCPLGSHRGFDFIPFSVFVGQIAEVL
jgi:hypothetical protein